MKKNVLIIITSVIIIVISITTITYAAFLIQANKGPLDFTVGKLSYEITGELSNDNYIYPGINLVEDPFVIHNKSTIKSEVRIKIDFYINNTLLDKELYNDYFDSFTVGSNWNLNENYYYLQVNDDFIIAKETTNIIIFEEIIFNGYKINNDFKEMSFNLKLTLEAKQADHVSWQDLGSALI